MIIFHFTVFSSIKCRLGKYKRLSENRKKSYQSQTYQQGIVKMYHKLHLKLPTNSNSVNSPSHITIINTLTNIRFKNSYNKHTHPFRGYVEL